MHRFQQRMKTLGERKVLRDRGIVALMALRRGEVVALDIGTSILTLGLAESAARAVTTRRFLCPAPRA